MQKVGDGDRSAVPFVSLQDGLIQVFDQQLHIALFPDLPEHSADEEAEALQEQHHTDPVVVVVHHDIVVLMPVVDAGMRLQRNDALLFQFDIANQRPGQCERALNPAILLDASGRRER